MANVNANLPESLNIGEKIRLIDNAWAILFPQYWASYRVTASRVNIATIKVVETLEDNTYALTVMDIVPEQGRVRIPAGLRIVCSIKDIQAALALSYKLSMA